MLKNIGLTISATLIGVILLAISLEGYVLARRALNGDVETFRRYQFGSHAGFEDMARQVSEENEAWKFKLHSVVAAMDAADLESVSTDETGFRTSCCAAPGIPKRSFLVLGGSTVMGVGTDDAHTIPSYLNRLGQDRGWVFRNLGVPANGSTEELLTLTLALRDGARPDDVVIYHGFNDLYTMAVGYGTKAQNAVTIEKILHSTPAYLYQKYIRNTAFGRFLRRIGLHDGSNPEAGMDPERDAIPVVELMRKNHAAARTLGGAYGFRVHHFLQPMLATGREYEAGLLNPYLKTLYERNVTPNYRDLTENVYAGLLQDGQWVDLTRTFVKAGYTSAYFDQIHLGPRGNELIAQEIFDHLVAQEETNAQGNLSPASDTQSTVK